ncbi:MAG TPA: S8 family peptidase [Natronosporangium sp.]|nr:S8 family peptidase [Natronosporangium sp.]
MVANPAVAAEGTILGAGHPHAVPNSYLVVLKDNAVASRGVEAQARALASRYGGEIGFVYDAAINGFSVTMSESAARRLAAHPAVEYVEQDLVVQLEATQNNPPSWGLDRIDQRNLPLNNVYEYPTTASNVNIYILDTGVRLTHNDFGGRAFTGFDAVTPGGSANDCHGHGTHVAGTAAGSSFGVAKGARIFAVRVLNCSGSGTTSQIVAGINWVTNNHITPAVANMSLGGAGVNTTMNNAVANSISAGVTYAIAAGNSNSNACNFSPALVPAAITVGATQINDARASFSNWGTCLDIFAPGQSITSAWHTSNSATNTISGTSMASPHVAGVAALILAANPNLTPAQVRNQMVADATTGVVGNPGTGSPNRLLFVNNGGGTPPPPPPPPPPGLVYQDSFETSTGWTLSGNATSGIFERGVPQATSFNGIPLQLSTVPHGSLVAVTGAAAGSDPGSNDVDNGATIITSPLISIPSSGNVNLMYEWTFAHLNNATSADYFRVSIISGGSTIQLHNVTGSATNRAGSWQTANFSLNQFRGSSIRIRIEVADNGTASLIEGAVDNVRIVVS